MLGMMQHPHHAKVNEAVHFSVPQKFYHVMRFAPSSSLYNLLCLQVTPKFCKQFGNVGSVINKALSDYKQEVETRSFPGPSHTPYKITATDVDGFANALQKMGLGEAADAAAAAAENSENDGKPSENS